MEKPPAGRRVRPVIKFLPGEVQTFRAKKPPYDEHHHPDVGSRLRLAHEHEETLSIETQIHLFEPKVIAVVRAKVTTFGVFAGIGTATSTRDRDKTDVLLEVAETRAIARALRFAGYGVEYAGVEEMERIENDAAPTDPTKAQASHGQVTEIVMLFASLGFTQEQQAAGMKKRNVKTVQELTQSAAAELITELKAKRDEYIAAAKGEQGKV